ncbi:ATP-binding protein, partial [Octadecabacter sp.]|nr:ATP-binding protein [Octadecabacter sp.]
APENDFIQDIKDNRKRNVWIAALVSLLTAAVGVTLAELILKPVRAFAVRTSLVSQGEVSANALPPKTYKELRDANQTLINEIAQRRILDAKVQDLNRELSHASRINMMGQMATGLAHELSQPLTAISQNVDTAISIAKQDETPQAELLTILSELDEQAHQGGDIIRSLRGFAKRDVHGRDPIDLDDLLSQTYRLMRRDFETHDVNVKLSIPALPQVAGNRIEFAQVLTNLMRNALDAMIAAQTNAKKITISARQVSDKVEVEVADTGPGVDQNVTLFKQFQTSKKDGLGLGLTISRAIVEANGGRLWYDPDTNGETRFLFTVPVHAIPESKT